MLWALTFHDGCARPITDLSAASQGAWTWAHFPLGDVRAQGFLSRIVDLPEAFSELLATRDDKIQIRGDGAWTFGVLPDLERDLSGKPIGPGRLFFAFDDQRLITARLHALRVIDDVRRQANQGLRLVAPADAVVALVEHYTELLEQRIETLTSRLDAVEDLVLSEPDDLDGRRLGPFRRELARHRREFQSLRSALVRGRAREPRLAPLLADQLAPLIGPVEDLDHDAAGLQERARLLHEEIDTLINSATNRSMRALTVISTLLIPPTLVVGAFGMNVEGIPFGHSHAGFVLASVVCLITVGGALMLLRRLRMLP